MRQHGFRGAAAVRELDLDSNYRTLIRWLQQVGSSVCAGDINATALPLVSGFSRWRGRQAVGIGQGGEEVGHGKLLRNHGSATDRDAALYRVIDVGNDGRWIAEQHFVTTEVIGELNAHFDRFVDLVITERQLAARCTLDRYVIGKPLIVVDSIHKAIFISDSADVCLQSFVFSGRTGDGYRTTGGAVDVCNGCSGN